MSEGKSPRTPIDDALASWPEAPRSDAEWEASARAIEARIANGPASSASLTDDALFAAPFADEPSAPAKKPERERERQKLRELAAMAHAQAKSAPDWAVEAEEAQAQAQAQAQPQPQAQAQAQAQARAQAQAPAHDPRRAGVTPIRPFVLGAVTALAVAAAAVFVLRPMTNAVETTKVIVMTPETTKAAAPPRAAIALASASAHDDAVDPSALPVAVASSSPPRAVVSAPPANAVALAPPPAVNPAPPPAAKPSSDAPDPERPLVDDMRQAAGPSARALTPAVTPAAEAPENVPTKPSMGAVNGAIGAVMNAARACLGPDDPVSHAQVSFQSNGSVQSVAITGGAAGKPAEACVRAALTRAKVAPFAQPTFTYTVTVRPL